MFAEYFLSLFESGAHRRRHEIFFGHDVVYRLIEIGFKAQVAVGQNAHELLAPGNGHAGNAVLGHQGLRIANQVIGREEERIGDHAMLAALDLVHLRSLLINGHVFVNDAQTALTRHGNGQPRVGHGIHGRAQQRDVELDGWGQHGRGVHIPRKHAACTGHQEHVVKCKACANVLLQHRTYPPFRYH